MTVLRIPDGNHLVMFFGKGNERSNHDALMTWVSSIYNEFDADEGDVRLEELARRVKLKIMSHMDSE